MIAVWSEPGFQGLAQLVTAKTGLTFTRCRGEDLERAARKAMERARINSVDELTGRLVAGDIPFDELLADITIGETHFFRDADQFLLLERRVISDIRRRKGEQYVIKAWSAGCSSGEEAYSIAILMQSQALLHQSIILGTDISPRALDKARAAEYGDWSLRGTNAAVVQQYFQTDGKKHVLSPSIRDSVTFRILNLAEDSYPSPATQTEGMDIILCRNVLIYFDQPTVKRVAEKFYRALSPGGWLVAGACDPDLSSFAAFEVVITESGVCYRRPAEEPRAKTVPPPPSGVRPRPAPAEEPRRASKAPTVRPDPPKLPNSSATSAAPAPQWQGTADHARGWRMPSGNAGGASAAGLEIREQWNREGAAAAEQSCAAVLKRDLLSAELHYVYAALLFELLQFQRAAQAAKRALYLDRSLAIAHFLLGAVLERIGDASGAARAYRNARQLSLLHPPESAISLGNGISAGGLADAAELGLTKLGYREGQCG